MHETFVNAPGDIPHPFRSKTRDNRAQEEACRSDDAGSGDPRITSGVGFRGTVSFGTHTSRCRCESPAVSSFGRRSSYSVGIEGEDRFFLTKIPSPDQSVSRIVRGIPSDHTYKNKIRSETKFGDDPRFDPGPEKTRDNTHASQPVDGVWSSWSLLF